MSDPRHPYNATDPKHGPTRGQAHGGQPVDLTAVGHHNQTSAVRGSGDQNPSDIYRSDLDREQEVRKEEW